MDWVERIRGLARQLDDLPCEVRVVINTLSDAELDRVRELLRRGGEPGRAEVRRCLDPVPGVRS